MIEKLEVEFRADINNKSLHSRRYTLTHSDETGQRYLFIGDEFAEDQYCKLRDEVVGEWSKASDKHELRIMCTLYAEHSSYTQEERFQIFKRHMPRAIAAIVNGDEEYITENNLLEYDVNAYYLSDIIPNMEYYGKVGEYMRTMAKAE